MAEEEAPPQNPPDPAQPSLGERIKSSPVTFALAAINIAVFAWVETHGGSSNVGNLLRFGAVERIHLASGEYWRVCTAMFLHGGFMHLFWNTYASFGWCTIVEKVLGRWRFLAVYLLAGIGGAAASAFFGRNPSVGASSAMFGIIGATMVLRYRVLGDLKLFVADKFVRSNVINMAIWTAFGAYALNIDNWAHAGGLVVGGIATFGATMAPARRRFGWALGVASTIALVVLAARPGWTPTGTNGQETAQYVLRYTYGAQGFPKNEARAERIRALACRDPESDACAATKPANIEP